MTGKEKFDIAVIGAGPGGYVAAIRAAQEGKKVALIEKCFLGGTCLNVGCIPTKTLLSSASVFSQVKNAEEFGIETGPVKVAYKKMKERKDSVVSKIRSGLEGLIKSNKITIFRGKAQFESKTELKITGNDNLIINAEKIIIATGSTPLDVKAFPCDHHVVLNSTSILDLTEVPKSLTIIGGGYIGCEFASLFAELGTKVTIIEALSSILALQGKSVSSFMTRNFKAKNIEIKTGISVKGVESKNNSARVTLSDGSTITSEKVLVSIGRKPHTDGLNLLKAGLSTDERGYISVNDQMETETKGIYAIGDVTGKAMLAHVASHQGIIAAKNALGLHAKAHYDAVPAVIFTSPEVGTVGLTLEEVQEKKIPFRLGTFPFQAIGKAASSGDTEGFSEIIADEKTGQILGAVVIGHEASNLIAEMALAVQNELTLECIYETIHTHPTLAEIWHETAAMALGTPIHLPPKRK